MTTTAIRPIETRFDGYRFRSRLEARYAVFFTTLGVPYRYEPQGYDLGAAGWYLPDFYLPASPQWIEIKPDAPTPHEIAKARALACAHQKVVDIYVGLPAPQDLVHKGIKQVLHIYPRSLPPGETVWVPFYDSCLHYLVPSHPEVGYPLLAALDGYRLIVRIQDALQAARSARFEHGQSGSPPHMRGA